MSQKNRLLESHFAPSELACKCGCGKTVEDFFLVYLEAVRLLIGEPMAISSGARCLTHNRIVGGAVGSKHVDGIAVDILTEDSAYRFKLIRAAIIVGFTGIGISDKFVHIDRRLAQPVIWTYPQSHSQPEP